LEDGVVLAVDGQKHCTRGTHSVHEQWASHDQRFLVGQQQPLARARGSERGAQARCTNDRGHDAIGITQSCYFLQHAFSRKDARPGSRVTQEIREIARRRLIRQSRIRRLPAANLLRQLRDVTVCGERHEPETIRMAREHIERAFAD
jgi:hypothetical protein